MISYPRSELIDLHLKRSVDILIAFENVILWKIQLDGKHICKKMRIPLWTCMRRSISLHTGYVWKSKFLWNGQNYFYLFLLEFYKFSRVVGCLQKKTLAHDTSVSKYLVIRESTYLCYEFTYDTA